MDEHLVQELRETRQALNAHLEDLRLELARVRATMQRVQPQLVVSDELGRSSNALSGNNQTAQARGPSPTGSSALLPSPSSSPRAASTLHLPPGPRFPLNPTASRSNTLVMGSPPRLPSPLASDDTLQLIQDEQSSDVRAFEPSRATRGSVRLLSRGPDSTSSSSSRTAASDAWIIPVYPFSESRGEAVQVTRPASENRTAAGVAESAEMNSATTRRTSAARASRTAFLQPGSAAASLLLGSGGGGGGMRDRLRLVDQESDAGRIVGNLRAAFLPHTVNIPPVPSERAQENPDLGDDESSAWLGPSRSRPLPNPSSGASTYASSSTLPAAGPLLTAGELDPNGENFDRSATRLPHHLGGYSIPGGDAEAILSEPSVWTPLPVLAPSTPSLVSPPHFSIETVPPSFGAPGFDRDSPEAQRRLERTSGLLEDLQQRRERLRYNIAALRAATAVDPPGDEALASVSNEREGPTVRVNNLRPPEQSTPAGSPARQHSSVSSRLLEALGGEGLGDIGRRLAREERENEVAGSLWDGWASYTGTSSWHADEPPDDLGVGVQASPPTAMTRADARDELQRTTSVLRPRFLHEGSPRANLEEHLRSAEQEDAARATRESLIVRAGRDHSTPGSRRNAPWLLGDGRPSTETRTGEEARFWPGVYGGGTLIFDVPRAQMQAILDASRGATQLPSSGAILPEERGPGPTAGSPYPWRVPQSSADHSRSPLPRMTSSPEPPPLGHRPSWIDQDGNWLPTRAAVDRATSREDSQLAPRRAPSKRNVTGEEVWFERPGPVALPPSSRRFELYVTAQATPTPSALDVRPAPSGRSARVGR